MTEKAPTKKMDTSNLSSENTEFRLLLCQRKGIWEGQEMIDDRRHLGTSRGQRKIVKILYS